MRQQQTSEVPIRHPNKPPFVETMLNPAPFAESHDEKIRALDSVSGAVLWEHKLPAGGYATPCTYAAGNKQYVAIACGGGNRQQTPSGDEYVVFSL